jgi:hypothetical protein
MNTMVVLEDCPHNIHNKPMGTIDKDESIILTNATFFSKYLKSHLKNVLQWKL